jgi:ribonuclease P/MRP protein subunit POP7
MAKEPPNPTTQPTHNKSKSKSKLPRLPPSQKIQKRPLLHPAIAYPRTGSQTQKIIYVSSTSPFISTIKRIRKYLQQIEARASASHPISLSKSGPGQVLKDIEAGIVNRKGSGERGRGGNGVGGKGGKVGVREEEVIVKGTGKAIERCLQVGLWAMQQEDLRVEVRTGSVGAVDDVVERGEEEGGEVESRVRRVSCLEVRVRLR